MATYNDTNHTLTIGDQKFTAYNNAASNSNGKWPKGTFKYERPTTHPDDGEDSAYGSHGNYIFTVPDRTDMGIHSGRKNKEDKAGRKGPQHATMGCIRTTDEGVAALAKVVKKDFVLTVE
jgi:hypothetical protein